MRTPTRWRPTGVGRIGIALAGIAVLGAQVVFVPLAAATPSPTATGVLVAAPFGAASNPKGQGFSVSCGAPGSCFEVGEYTNSSGYEMPAIGDIADGNAEQYEDLSGAVPANASATPNDDYLDGISCPNVAQCETVGAYDLTAGGQGAYGLQWDTLGYEYVDDPSILQIAPPATTVSPQSTGLSAISCVTINNCVAVGYFTETGVGVTPMIATETNGAWATGVTPASEPAGFGGANFLGVSCLSAGNCVAVGVGVFPAGLEGIIDQETNGTWATSPTIAALPNDASVSSQEAELTSVSCVPSGTCEAVGGYLDTTSNLVPLTIQRIGGSWVSPSTVGLPAGALSPEYGYFSSVSCITTSGLCEAVGQYSTTGGGGQALTALSRGGAWHASQTLPAPAELSSTPPAALLNGVYCQQSGACSAVGGFEDFDSLNQFMWAPVNTPPSPVTSITAVSMSHSTAKVSWVPSAVTGAGIDHFEVYLSTDGGVNYQDLGSAGTATSRTVTGLVPGHTYHFEVIATDVALVNSGPAYAPYVQYTKPSAPRSPHAAPGARRATLSWTPPASTGFSPVRSYTVTMTWAGGSKVVSTTATHLVVAGLSSTVTYAFHVQAVNKAGPGASSPVVHFRPAA